MSRYPKSWVQVRLSDVVEVVRPRVHPQSDPDIPFVGMDNVEAHTMRLLGTVPAGTMKSSAVSFQPGDVLYGRLRPYLNKVVGPSFAGLASAEFIPLTPKPGIDSGFVRYRINASDFVQFTSHLDEGDRPRVDWDGISAFELALPPSSEQARMAQALDSLLSRLDAAEKSLEQAQAKLKAYRASVLKAAVEGRLVPTEAELARQENRSYESAKVLLERILKERRRRWEESELARLKKAGKAPKNDKWKSKYKEPEPPDTTTLPQLPEGWCWVGAAALSVAIGDVDHRMPKAHNNGVPYVSTRDFYGVDGIDFEGAKKIRRADYDRLSRKISPERGDILLSRYGTVGEVRLVRTDGHFQASYSIAIVKLVDRALGTFVVNALRAQGLQAQIRRHTRATAQPDLGLEHIRSLVVPLPPMAEQLRVVDEVDRVLSVCESDALLVKLSQGRIGHLRQSILKWAFEGRLVDQDPNEEPAEQLLARIRVERAASPAKTRRTPRRKKS